MNQSTPEIGIHRGNYTLSTETASGLILKTDIFLGGTSQLRFAEWIAHSAVKKIKFS
jgi:hypothetical protein